MGSIVITTNDPQRGKEIYVGKVDTDFAIFRIERKTSQHPFHVLQNGYGVGRDALEKARAARATKVCIIVIDDDNPVRELQGRVVAEFLADLDLWFTTNHEADYERGVQLFLGPDDLPKRKMPRL